MVLLYLCYKTQRLETDHRFGFQISDMRLSRECHIYIYIYIFTSLREAQQFFAFTLLTPRFVLVHVTDSTFCLRRKRKGLYNLSYAICLNKPSLFLDFKKIQMIGLSKFGNPSSFYINYIQLLLLLLLLLLLRFYFFLFLF